MCLCYVCVCVSPSQMWTSVCLCLACVVRLDVRMWRDLSRVSATGRGRSLTPRPDSVLAPHSEVHTQTHAHKHTHTNAHTHMFVFIFFHVSVEADSSVSSASSSPSTHVGVDPSVPPRLLTTRPGELGECYYKLAEQGTCSRLATNSSQQECCCTVGEGWGLGCQYLPCPPAGTGETAGLRQRQRKLYNWSSFDIVLGFD